MIDSKSLIFFHRSFSRPTNFCYLRHRFLIFFNLELYFSCMLKRYRILRMHGAGLVNLWLNRFRPMPSQCMTDPTDRKEIMAQIRNPSLVNLKILYSAFLYLILGFTLSFIALSIEWVRKLYERLPHWISFIHISTILCILILRTFSHKPSKKPPVY